MSSFDSLESSSKLISPDESILMEGEKYTSDIPTIFSTSTLTRKGLCPVPFACTDKVRTMPLTGTEERMYYELHGKGPRKVLFIMGLNGTSSGWSNQVSHFANDKRYSLLLIDNMGVGGSDSPNPPYSTRGMARDTLWLLDTLGWKSAVNLVGVSMGGMISQHMALIDMPRFSSLSLIVSTAGSAWNFPTMQGIKGLILFQLARTPLDKAPIQLNMMYPAAWLAAELEPGVTNKDAMAKLFMERYSSSGPQPFKGALGQFSAALRHYISHSTLSKLSSIPHVSIITGTEDNLIQPYESFRMRCNIPDSTLTVLDGAGHGVLFQMKARINELLDVAWEKGHKASEKKTR